MKALTVGGAMVDTIAIIESDRIERMQMRNADTAFLLLEEGRKTEALEVGSHVGGGAINVAVAMARLGHDVATLVMLGRDARAETVLQRLMDEGVSTRFVVRDAGAPTGASVLVSSHERDAAIFTFRGANTLLRPSNISDDALAVDLVYVSSLSNQSADCFPELVARAKAAGAFVATNPGVRQLSARGGVFLDSLAHIDLLTINRVEAETLVPVLVAEFGEGGPSVPCKPGDDLPVLARRGLEGGGFEMTLAGFGRALAARGVRYTVITDGGAGAYVFADDVLTHCPIRRTDVLGTAGAGDSFAATLSAQIASSIPVADALMAAVCNAASVVTYVDTQTGLLDAEALAATVRAANLSPRAWPIDA